jgi:hypothetical protein
MQFSETKFVDYAAENITGRSLHRNGISYLYFSECTSSCDMFQIYIPVYILLHANFFVTVVFKKTDMLITELKINGYQQCYLLLRTWLPSFSITMYKQWNKQFSHGSGIKLKFIDAHNWKMNGTESKSKVNCTCTFASNSE